ncbi:MAG: M28 family peptidase [Planctomycetaceae bacterium]|nr:M28 family peptidase [Planctomycetaceae bacterium]
MPIRQHRVPLVICVAVSLASFTWFARGYHGPEVVAVDAPADRFSAARGLQRLRRILGDETPHPAGTPENDTVRQRLLAELRALKLEVWETPFQVQRVNMTNVLAVLRGDSRRRPILLATHHDSVSAGPGAGDAGSCVAALLETARLIDAQTADDPSVRCDIWFLFTDGEEWVRGIGHGLNGAMQFAQTAPDDLMAADPLILNFDARGATGPSVMYETSGANLRLLQHVLPALPRPAYTASSYVSVYELLPNATDFTVFKQAGATGLNFAFLDDPHLYHTPDDSLKNLDPRSVQHHGENATAMVQALMTTSDADFQADENAVFFTVLNRWVVCYPASWAPALAGLLLVVQLIGCVRRWRFVPGVRSLLTAMLVVFVVLMSGIVIGAAINSFNDYRPRSFHGFGPYDPLIVAGLWALVFLAAAVVPLLFRKHSHADSMWLVVWMGTAVAGLLSAIYLPGFSYIMLSIGVVPAVLSLTVWRVEWMCVPAVAVAALLQAPLAYQFGVALGPKMASALGALFVLFLLPLFPLLAAAKAGDDGQQNVMTESSPAAASPSAG